MPKRTEKSKIVFRRRFTSAVIWVILFAFVFGGILFFTPGGLSLLNSANTPEDEPAVLVNGEKIGTTKLDFETQSVIQQQRNLYRQFNLGDFDSELVGAQGSKRKLDMRSGAAGQLIRELLLIQEANKRNVSAPGTQVALRFRQQYDQMLQQFGVSEDELEKILKTKENQEFFRQFLFTNGIMQVKIGTLNEFRDGLRKEQEIKLKQEKLQDLVVGEIKPNDADLLQYVQESKNQYLTQIIGPYAPTDEEVRAYFDAHPEKYSVEKAKARHIQIDVPEGATEEEMLQYYEKLAAADAKLSGGAEFGAVAQELSEDEFSRFQNGEVDFFERGKSRYDTADNTAFSDAAFTQAIGERKTVRSAVGLHLMEVLERKVTSFDDIKDQVRQDLITEQQEAKFSAWFDAAKASGIFPQSDEVHARHILISLASNASESAVQTAMAKLDRLVVELKDGKKSFEDLAKEFSDDTSNKNQGGDLGWFGHGRMVAEFDRAVFALDINQISEPVKTQYGYHIIQLLERRPTDALKEQVQTDYVAKKERDQFEAWVKETTDKAAIEYKDPLLFAYNFEKKAREATDPNEKLKLFDEAIKAYDTAKQGVVGITSNDPFIGYYQSEIDRSKIDILEAQLKELGEDAASETKKALEDKITEERRLATERFLEGTYAEPDSFVFERAVSEDRENSQLRYRYAIFLRDAKKDSVAAYGQLQETLRLDPTAWSAHELAADIKMAEGSYDIAVEHLNSALGLVGAGTPEQRQLRLKLATASLELGRFTHDAAKFNDAAQILLELRGQLAESDRSYPDLLATLGDVYMELGQAPDAEEAYRESLKLSNRTAIEVKMGRALLAQKKLDEAERALQRASTRDVYSIDARIVLGDVYLADGKTDDALVQYRDALTLTASNDVKRDVSKKVLSIKPDDLDTRIGLAEYYAADNMNDDAIEQYQLVLQSDPSSWKANKGLGLLYQNRNEFRMAMDRYKTALQLNAPTIEQIQINQRILETEQALVGFENPLGPDGQEAILQLADLYAKQGNYVESRKRLDELKTKYPEYETERVASLLSSVENTGNLASDGLPGLPVEDQGREHIDPGTTHANYSSVPPTSGPHYPSIAPYGISTSPIPNELQIHNLEHGAIAIQYQSGLDASAVQTLTGFVEGMRKQTKFCKLILAPYEGLDKPIALTAWGRIMKLEAFDEAKATGFINQFIDKGPEKVDDCRL